MRIYQCEDSLDGILTGVYEGFDSRIGHVNLKLVAGEIGNYELFAEYVKVEADLEKAVKVGRTIRQQLGEEAYTCICQAALADNRGKADYIYRVIVVGLANVGKPVMNHLSYDPVNEVFRLSRQVWHEVHKLMGFLRFQELNQGVLFGKIAPRHNVLTLLAPHFEDRLPNEDFIIYDETRKQAMIHQKQENCFLVSGKELQQMERNAFADDEEQYEQLFRCFVKSIAIKERTNRNLQRNLLPIRFRSNMVEFQERKESGTVN